MKIEDQFIEASLRQNGNPGPIPIISSAFFFHTETPMDTINFGEDAPEIDSFSDFGYCRDVFIIPRSINPSELADVTDLRPQPPYFKEWLITNGVLPRTHQNADPTPGALPINIVTIPNILNRKTSGPRLYGLRYLSPLALKHLPHEFPHTPVQYFIENPMIPTHLNNASNSCTFRISTSYVHQMTRDFDRVRQQGFSAFDHLSEHQIYRFFIRILDMPLPTINPWAAILLLNQARTNASRTSRRVQPQIKSFMEDFEMSSSLALWFRSEFRDVKNIVVDNISPPQLHKIASTLDKVNLYVKQVLFMAMMLQWMPYPKIATFFDVLETQIELTSNQPRAPGRFQKVFNAVWRRVNENSFAFYFEPGSGLAMTERSQLLRVAQDMEFTENGGKYYQQVAQQEGAPVYKVCPLRYLILVCGKRLPGYYFLVYHIRSYYRIGPHTRQVMDVLKPHMVRSVHQFADQGQLETDEEEPDRDLLNP